MNQNLKDLMSLFLTIFHISSRHFVLNQHDALTFRRLQIQHECCESSKNGLTTPMRFTFFVAPKKGETKFLTDWKDEKTHPEGK